MEEKHLRSMKACVIDISMQVENILTKMSYSHYIQTQPEREIIKEAIKELNRIIMVNQKINNHGDK